MREQYGAKLQIGVLRKALEVYRRDIGDYPSSEEGLQALWINVSNHRAWTGPYLQGSPPLDPWGNPYTYFYAGNSAPVIRSLGADGRAGGSGINSDLSN